MGRIANQGSKWIRRDKRLAIYLRDDCSCAYCGRDASMGAVLTLDHVVAGGSNGEANLVTCCRSCNSAKNDISTRAWFLVLRARGFDTTKMGRRIRRLTARDLSTYRAQAKHLIASMECEGSVAQLAMVG